MTTNRLPRYGSPEKAYGLLYASLGFAALLTLFNFFATLADLTERRHQVAQYLFHQPAMVASQHPARRINGLTNVNAAAQQLPGSTVARPEGSADQGPASSSKPRRAS